MPNPFLFGGKMRLIKVLLLSFLVLNAFPSFAVAYNPFDHIGEQAGNHLSTSLPMGYNDTFVDPRSGYRYKVTSTSVGNGADTSICNAQITTNIAIGATSGNYQYRFWEGSLSCEATSSTYRKWATVYVTKLAFCDLPEDGNYFYSPDGLTCNKNTPDFITCSVQSVEQSTASGCCSNGLRDGMEYSIDKGGACENLATVCPYGGDQITIGGVTFCGVAREEHLDQTSCQASGLLWESGACYLFIGAPVYAGPSPDSTGGDDATLAANKTNAILTDSINANNVASAKVVAALDTNTDVTNQGTGRIVAAIAENKSAIVAAIQAITVEPPAVNVAAPVVNVSAPVVNVDTAGVTAAVQVNGGKLDQTNGKLDQVNGKLDSANGFLNGVAVNLDAALASAIAARDEAAAASGQAIIRADATNTKLDQTNGKMDQTNGKLDTLNGTVNGLKTTLDASLIEAQAIRESTAQNLIKQDANKTAIDGVKTGIDAMKTALLGKPSGVDLNGIHTRLDSIDGKLATDPLNIPNAQPTLDGVLTTATTATDANNTSLSDELTAQATEAKDMAFPVTETISNKIKDLFGSTGGGGSYTLTFGQKSYIIPAETFDKTRTVLSWFCACMTLVVIFQTLTAPIRGN